MRKIERLDENTHTVIKQALRSLDDQGLHAEWADTGDSFNQAVAGVLTISRGKIMSEFPAVARSGVTPADIALIPHDNRTVLVTDRVPPSRAEQLASRGWGGYVDSSGNASLRSDDIIVEVSGRRNMDRVPKASAAAPFTKAGLPVTFAILVANEGFGITPSQRNLAATSGTSLGTVNRVIQALRARTPTMLSGPRNELVRPELLRHEWISAYSAIQPSAWPEERYESGVWQRPEDVLASQLPPSVLLGSEAAASRLGAPIRPESVLLHFEGDDSDRMALIRQGRLRKVENGMIRVRPALWRIPPTPPENGTAPRLMVQADLLMEDDPRLGTLPFMHFRVQNP